MTTNNDKNPDQFSIGFTWFLIGIIVSYFIETFFSTSNICFSY